MAKAGKRIGFVDDDLNNYHAKVYLAAFRGELAGRGFEVAGAVAKKKKSSKAWAKENDVPWFDSPEALNEAVDYYIVLAPGTPKTHLELCEWVFPFGKTTYVDKTFAPDVATAKKIFKLADKHGLAMQTTSALRYTGVQLYANDVGRNRINHMVTWGGGRSFHEYAIHPTELCISCMGPKVERLMRFGSKRQSRLVLEFSNKRTAVINVLVKTKVDFAASVTTTNANTYIPVDGSRIFIDTAAAMLDLFESGTPNIPREESMAVMRVLEAARKPEAQKGFVKV